MHYTSPEARIGSASDIWALACTIFEIRAGTTLFYSFCGGNSEIVMQTVEMPEKLPEPWWNAFEHRQTWFEDNGEPKSREIQDQEGVLLPAMKSSILQKLREIGERDELPEANEGLMFEAAGTQLEEREVELLGDLLEKMLRYRPEERVTIQEVMQHPWFKYAHVWYDTTSNDSVSKVRINKNRCP